MLLFTSTVHTIALEDNSFKLRKGEFLPKFYFSEQDFDTITITHIISIFMEQVSKDQLIT